METLITSKGEFHSVTVRITPDEVEIIGDFDRHAAWDASIAADAGDEIDDWVQTGSNYRSCISEALEAVVGDLVRAGVVDGRPVYRFIRDLDLGDYRKADMKLADGRPLSLRAYYDGLRSTVRRMELNGGAEHRIVTFEAFVDWILTSRGGNG